MQDPNILTAACVLLGLNLNDAGDGDNAMDTSEPPPRASTKTTEKRKEPSKPEPDTSNLTEDQKKVQHI